MSCCTEPLPKLLSPYDYGAIIFLKRPGNDFSARGAPCVNKYYNRIRVFVCICFSGFLYLSWMSAGSNRDNNGTFLQKFICNFYCLVQQPAGIVAQVDD